MPSPFPGMNPYLEQTDAWEDFHQSFMTQLRNDIAARVSAQYIVKLEAHIYLHELSAEQRLFLGKGDVGVSSRMEAQQPSFAMSATLQAPVQVRIPGVEQEKSSFIEIRDRENRSLITVIELLSPANKYSGPDREAYLAKRTSLLHGQVNFVELDLMRGGPRMPIPDFPTCDYYALVRRVIDWPLAGLWPVNLRDRLPIIPIPLRAPDPDIAIDLQGVLHAVYDAAHYENYVYTGAPQPPLSLEDQAWAAEMLRTSRAG